MTHITNKKLEEHTFTGETFEDMLMEMQDEIGAGKLNGEKILHGYFTLLPDDGEDTERWVARILVSTYENKK